MLGHYELRPDAGTRITGTPRLLPTTPAGTLEFRKQLLSHFPADRIRNVSIVAHVDHGKTTLTDALLRKAGLLPSAGATGTFTDRLAVEKERGITVKAQTCSIFVTRREASPVRGVAEEVVYLVNLIDTPGHVDFQYEVSRSLCATEGALLLVDVLQGVEAQTMAQFYAALEHNLAMIPVLTKLDQVMQEEVVTKALAQLEDTAGFLRDEVILTSAKTKRGLEPLLEAVLDRIPPPSGRQGCSDWTQLPLMHPESAERRQAEDAMVPLRALLFDCWTVESSGMSHTRSPSSSASGTASRLEGVPVMANGIYCLVRILDGTVTPGTVATFFHSKKRFEVKDVGIIHPTLHPTAALTAGMVGYLFFAGLTKSDVLIGDTLCTIPTKKHMLAATAVSGETSRRRETARIESEGTATATTGNDGSSYVIEPAPGFKTVRPVVFAGFYPDEGESIAHLREAVDLLCVNDPSVAVEPLQCPALGAGLQLGFLGLLHMQVFKDRLLAEFGRSVLVTPPQVQYMCVVQGAAPASRKPITVSSWRWPHEGVVEYLEPTVVATVITPKESFSAINAAATGQFRGEQEDMRVVDDARVLVRYRMPLADLARGFFTVVKSASHGYATLDYAEPEYVVADLVKMDIVINKAKIYALSIICPRNEANSHGKRMLSILKNHLTRSSVDLPLQAYVGSKIIARETVKAYRKDVTANIHAGDISRKQKKWNDQKKGKERMARRSFGTVTLDQSVLVAVMGGSSGK